MLKQKIFGWDLFVLSIQNDVKTLKNLILLRGRKSKNIVQPHHLTKKTYILTTLWPLKHLSKTHTIKKKLWLFVGPVIPEKKFADNHFWGQRVVKMHWFFSWYKIFFWFSTPQNSIFKGFLCHYVGLTQKDPNQRSSVLTFQNQQDQTIWKPLANFLKHFFLLISSIKFFN